MATPPRSRTLLPLAATCLAYIVLFTVRFFIPSSPKKKTKKKLTASERIAVLCRAPSPFSWLVQQRLLFHGFSGGHQLGLESPTTSLPWRRPSSIAKVLGVAAQGALHLASRLVFRARIASHVAVVISAAQCSHALLWSAWSACDTLSSLKVGMRLRCAIRSSTLHRGKKASGKASHERGDEHGHGQKKKKKAN